MNPNAENSSPYVKSHLYPCTLNDHTKDLIFYDYPEWSLDVNGPLTRQMGIQEEDTRNGTDGIQMFTIAAAINQLVDLIMDSDLQNGVVITEGAQSTKMREVRNKIIYGVLRTCSFDFKGNYPYGCTTTPKNLLSRYVVFRLPLDIDLCT